MIKIPGLFLMLLLAISTGRAYAQTAFVTGKIVNKDSDLPVEGANIMLLQGSDVTYRTATDSRGRFKIPQSLYLQMTVLRITSINYQDLKIDKKFSAEQLQNKNYLLGTFALKPGKIELQEVKVNAKRRYSDTTNINLSKNKFERSIMMDDLFSGNYGFTKDKNGRIYYKGNLVSNILVDGGDFFGKNNFDIYHLLPALTMENIQVVETNIDSTTNTTKLRPVVKVNLTLKPQYNKGKFGNANAGGGTSTRYLANTDLYAYRNKQQLSLDLNLNNVNAGDNLIKPPSISFSATGNSLNARGARFTYRNVVAKKLDVNFEIKGRLDNKLYTSLSERNDLDIRQFSKTTNASNIKTWGIDNANFNINYRTDPLNSFNISQSFGSVNTRVRDSLNYIIKSDSTNTISKVGRLNNTLTENSSSRVLYLHRFASKKGRLLNVSAIYNDNSYHINESNNIYNLNHNITKTYFIDGKRLVTNRQLLINNSYTEPLGENSYITIFANYKKDDIVESDDIKSDAVVSYLTPAGIYNQYLETGLKFQHTFSKVSFDGNITGIFNSKDIHTADGTANNSFKVNFDLKTDYKVDPRKNLLLTYSLVTTYPDIHQLSSLNSNFDLVSQLSGNPNLKPQDNYSIKAAYDLKSSDTESLLFSGEFNYYTSKFGYAIVSAGTFLSSVTTNVGNAKSGALSFSFNKNFANQRYINSTSSLSYQENPSFVSGQRVLNSGILFNQSVSTTLPIVKSLVTLTPLLAASYSKFNFGTGSSNVITFTYSDRISLTALKSEVSLFPLFTYSHNINNNHSFSMNGEIKRSFFKNYVSAWLQAYDIFNSFKFYNNYVGPTYTQTISYSNIQRYVFLGVSYKFNNFK
ncbi:outer membrane beta-barrel protein [Mucilaginibacter flavidus]|uniref:outer membrane beta-barrel protein n=1 Tax=Mucilaginibacter flavidus TaxID=2949309 RepID=UPI002093EB82|nr:outer membrane beta-barrel protein [Mucilaginibacter flavidus]MCO5945897.1 outer membrane beta-barrel protein [Mucilaginibacter flavidus]